MEAAGTIPKQEDMATRRKGDVGNPARRGTMMEAFSRLITLDVAGVTELTLARHAEPDYAAVRDNGGDPTDPPLSERGRRQAELLAGRLLSDHIDAIYSSTMRRAYQTALAVAEPRGMAVERIHDLREVGFDFQALKAASSQPGQVMGKVISSFISNPRWDVFPGCEPSTTFRRRVVQAVEGILARHTGGRVLVVCHGGVINAYLSMILGIDRDMFFQPEHTSLSAVRHLEDLYAVRYLNDHAHLSPGV